MPTVSGERLSLSLRVSKARCTRSNASSALSLQQQACTKGEAVVDLVVVVVWSGGGENGGIFQGGREAGQNSPTGGCNTTCRSAASPHTISRAPSHVPPYAAPHRAPPSCPSLQATHPYVAASRQAPTSPTRPRPPQQCTYGTSPAASRRCRSDTISRSLQGFRW